MSGLGIVSFLFPPFPLSLHPSHTDPHSSTGTGDVDIPSLPPIPLEQLDTAISMLLTAIRKDHHQHHTSPFASRLLIMMLAFLTRLIKGQALLEERAEEEDEGEEGEGEGRGEREGREELLKVDKGMCTCTCRSSLHSLCTYAPFFLTVGVSSRYRTISGASVESGSLTCTQTPAISLPTLTQYIQQLRAYLPNANLIGLQV